MGENANNISGKRLVLVLWGCYNWISCWWLYNKRNPFLPFPEDRKSKIKALADSVPWGSAFWFTDAHPPTASYHGGRNKGALWSLLYKGANPMHKSSVLMTQSSPKGPTSKHHHIGHQGLTYEWGEWMSKIQTAYCILQSKEICFWPICQKAQEAMCSRFFTD